MGGVLEGVRIVELAGLGAAPFAAMMLADHGAAVIRVEREGGPPPAIPPGYDIIARGRASVVRLDLKTEQGAARLRGIAAGCDGLIEGFRPGVMERLGLGPEALHADNPRLVYGRMTGWGQEGPLARTAGHDIDYIALSGALSTYGRAGGAPTPPLNAVGDYGGGGMLMAFGMLAGILSARRTGRGTVIDCAMVDGAALLSALSYGLHAAGLWREERGTNLLDTGAAFYDSYECADGKWVAVGALEPEFFAILKEKMGLASAQHDPALRAELVAAFSQHPRAYWCDLLQLADACFAPILTLSEAPAHPHNALRGTFANIRGYPEPAPAPRFKDPA